MKHKSILILISFLVLIIILNSFLYTIDETEQTVKIQLGKVVEPAVTEPGLHTKIPFIQSLIYYPKYIMAYDSEPKVIITLDKKNLIVDNYARWQIIDPIIFYKKVRSNSKAQSILDDVIYSDLRDELSRCNMEEIRISTMGANMRTNRTKIMQLVTNDSDKKLRQYGIKVIDVRIKRVELPEENQMAVYQRMRAERERVTAQYLALGEEKAKEIRAEADKFVTVELAHAREEAEQIKGKAEAEAAAIYAEAYKKDPQFFAFYRALEAYEKTIDEKTTLVLPLSSSLYKYLK